MASLYCILAFSTFFNFAWPSGLSGSSVVNCGNEICDNAIDDDGDGAIDLNDADCLCEIVAPKSLIPNPSFEEMDCCPFEHNQLECATGWQQASQPTTDFMHDCGWRGWGEFLPPRPLPDGEGLVGFRNGRIVTSGYDPRWKEYIGACLRAPLLADSSYRLEFYLGFTNPIVSATFGTLNYSPPLEIAVFGNRSCQNLPFGVTDAWTGCPTNDTLGWIDLGQHKFDGEGEWLKVTMILRPQEDIYAIAIGPSCTPIQHPSDTYYFLDNLLLDKQSIFEFTLDATRPCDVPFRLKVAERNGATYQWYKEGVALLGETEAELVVKTGEGDYQVRVMQGGLCQLTQPYEHRIPRPESTTERSICEGNHFPFFGKQLIEAGTYEKTIKDPNGCDSLVRVHLEVVSELADSIAVKVFPGSAYQIGRFSFEEPGEHVARLKSSLGCDSLVYLSLSNYELYLPNAFTPNDDGINDYFQVYGSNSATLIKSMQVFSRWGDLVFSAEGAAASRWDGWHGGLPLEEGVYVYRVVMVREDGEEVDLVGSISLLR